MQKGFRSLLYSFLFILSLRSADFFMILLAILCGLPHVFFGMERMPALPAAMNAEIVLPEDIDRFLTL